MEGRPLTDAELIDAARRGEVAAYVELVRRYEQLAFRTAFLLCGDADEARDAAQEGFVRAYGALRRFRTGAEPRPWLLRIVANAARNRRRAAGRRASVALRSAQDRPSDGAAPSPEAAVLAPGNSPSSWRPSSGWAMRTVGSSACAGSLTFRSGTSPPC